MSGQPNRNPTDPAKFRQQYLANLALEANINDKNLQANKVYKKTGQIPEMTDNRTTAEKLADVERLKIDVRSELSEIADGNEANAIVQELPAFELEFLAQHIKEIVADIKPKYKYGITAPIFIPYLASYINRAIQTNEVNYGLQQETGDNIILGIQQIMGNMINLNDLAGLQQQIHNAHLQGFINTALLYALRRDADQLAQVIPDRNFFNHLAQQQDADTQNMVQQELNRALQNVPTQQQLQDLQGQLNQAIQNGDRQRSQQIADALHQILALDPVSVQEMQQIKAEVLGEIGQLRQDILVFTDQVKDEIIQNLRDAGVHNVRVINEIMIVLKRELKDATHEEAENVVQTLVQIIQAKQEPLTKKDIKEVVEEAIKEVSEMSESTPNRQEEELSFSHIYNPQSDILDEPYEPSSSLPFKSVLSKESPALPQKPRLIPKLDKTTVIANAKKAEISASKYNELIQYLKKNSAQTLTTDRTRAIYVNAIFDIYPNFRNILGIPENLSINYKLGPKLKEIIDNIAVARIPLAEQNYYRTVRQGDPNERGGGGGRVVPKKEGKGFRMSGRGVSKKPNVVLQTDFSQGIMPTQKYVPFGRYFIDHHRINDDVISLRRGNGVNIVGLPVRRVSRDLGEVVRTILKQDHPSYNQIDKLSKEEKDYLHKLAKSSNLLDRLHIPSPTKEEDDQDINQFEILKGELLCGNDGSETIKKFKVLVMRMMNKGLLPRGQAKDILIELATLGY